MFRAITAFELKYHLKSPLFYILLAVYFLLTFAAVTTDGVTLGGSVGNVNRNAPYVIMMFLLVMSIFGILTTTAFVANSVHRDFELNTDALFFSSPVRKWQYLGGRFAGSITIALMVYLGVVGAIMIGSKMWWIDKERLGPFEIFPYAYSLLVMIGPNLLLVGAIFFAIAALTRSMMATYTGAVGFIVAWAVASNKLENVEKEVLAALLDPFGFSAFSIATRYWTVFQKNTMVVPLEGVYLWNRILWTAVALAIFSFAVWKFDFSAKQRRNRKLKWVRSTRGTAIRSRLRWVDVPVEPRQPEPIHRIALALPRPTQSFGRLDSIRQYWATVKLEAGAIFKSIPFIIILSLGVLNLWGNSTAIDQIFGTSIYPVTGQMVDMIAGAFSIFAVLIAAFYAGDIVWRERNLKLHEVTDAMPLPVWAQWAAKLTALLLVMIATLAAAILTSMVIQVGHGYYNFEPMVYVKGVLFDFGFFLLLIAAFSFIVQVLFNQKFVGFLGVMLFFIMNRALPALDFEHRLYRFGSVPPSTWSDMNGWGHFTRPILAFNAYWILFSAALLAVCHLLWVRGTEGGWRQRLSIARQRFGAPVAAALAVTLLGFVSTGCYIYYNTNVLNEYRTADDVEKLQAETEKLYKKYERVALPKVTAVQADVDLYPERREVVIRGQYTLQNKTAAPISELHVTHSPNTLPELKLDLPASVKLDDREHGYAIYKLNQPLAPGATIPMKFQGRFAAHGFVNGQSNTNVVANGTFINSQSYFPHLGYNSENELQDRNDRKKHGLGPIERMKKPNDMQARMSNGLSDSDWLSLDTTVSTVPSQIAIAPGYLQREWTAHGRRYFHYKTTSPILGFWSYLSAEYTVKRDHWTSPTGEKIPIEIYYDAKHPYNVDRMIYATKKSLDYFTKNFSPYQHKQVRILEFPAYARFAQSFPNTIPYSESIGFIADLRDPEAIDYVYYVTAHEVAHQWWAHQVIGGNVQGSTMIVETMAQYSALMVMEKEYGRAKMQKFLRYELDRYLAGRGGELVAEMPLSLVENQQYIHYRKGSLIMYALRDYIGEEAVNRALAKFIRDHAFDEPPYTTATELVQYFRAEAPPEYQETITDLFERIVLYDNQVKTVSSTRRPDGKYTVQLTVTSKKFRSDGKGEEKETPVNDLIDIGVLAEKDKQLFLEKRRITEPVETFEIVVSGKPAKAGIDPYHKLIDRNPKDNLKSL
jgi:ABC-2 type transport system permease protein